MVFLQCVEKLAAINSLRFGLVWFRNWLLSSIHPMALPLIRASHFQESLSRHESLSKGINEHIEVLLPVSSVDLCKVVETAMYTKDNFNLICSSPV